MTTRDIHFLYNFGGNGNYGDDLILHSWISLIAQERPDLTVLAGVTKSWMQACFVGQNVHFSDFVTRASMRAMVQAREAQNGLPLTIDDRIAAGRAAARQLLEPDDQPWSDALRRIRAFHIAGGGFLNELFPVAFGYASTIAGLSRELDVPLYGTGLGLMPNPRPTGELARLYESFDLLECRDSESYDLLIQSGIGADLVDGVDDTFLGPVRTDDDRERAPGVVLNVQSDLVPEDDWNRCIAIVERLLEGGLVRRSLHHLVLYEQSDRSSLARLRERGLAIGRENRPELLLNRGLPVTADDLVITSRFHCHLLAARVGARGVYLVGQPGYYDVKHASVAALGSGWAALNVAEREGFDLAASAGPAIDNAGLQRFKRGIAARVLGLA